MTETTITIEVWNPQHLCWEGGFGEFRSADGAESWAIDRLSNYRWRVVEITRTIRRESN